MNQDKQRIKNALKELLDGKKRVVEIEISNKKNINLRPFRAWYNKLVVIVTQKIPPMWFKSFLLKSTGLNLGDEVCIPMYNYFDVYFPELITIKGNTLIGGLSQYYAHEFKEEDGKLKLVLGKIFVDENVLVSGGAKLYPGSYVNKNSIVGLYTNMRGETKEGEFWGSKDARLIKKFSKDEIDKYFKMSGEKPEKYYETAKKKQDDFRKNKSERLIKILYGGDRGNAGNDWWRARNVLRIYLNGMVMEFFNLLGIQFLKKMAYRMVGVKIGKNVFIGRNSMPDHIHPEYISIGDNATIGKGGYIDGHEYGVNYSMYGRTIIGDDVRIGHDVLIRAGTTVGKNAVIDDNSVVLKDVPSGEHWAGCPAKKVEGESWDGKK